MSLWDQLSKRLRKRPDPPSPAADEVPPPMMMLEVPSADGDTILVPAYDYDYALYFDSLEGQALRDTLDRLVSPRVAPLGLAWRGDYYWVGESVDGIRKVLRYTLLGGRGVFNWGVCLDFVKLPSGNKLVFHRTERTARLHLFEHSPGHIDSFEGVHIGMREGMGVCCHSRVRAEHTISRSIDFIIGEVAASFERMGTLDGVRSEAERQIREAGARGNVYGMHFPNPAYILAFVHAQQGRRDEAASTLATLRDDHDAYRLDLVEPYLRKLAGQV